MSTHTIEFEGIQLEYELTRKPVKYINLRVNKKGEVVVSAPHHAPLQVVQEFIASKALWIIQHLATVEKLTNGTTNFGLHDGKTVYFLGKPYCLRLEHGENSIAIKNDEIIMATTQVAESALLEDYLAWLKTMASPKFEEILNRIYPLVADLNIQKPQIQIRNMTTRWGSCTTTSNNIRLNLQLIKASEDCIEQVILHELLHFSYPNHKQEFYDALSARMPDWKERKKRLETKYHDGI